MEIWAAENDFSPDDPIFDYFENKRVLKKETCEEN